MKLIKFLLLIIIFAMGVYVGNVYLPQKGASIATAISAPTLDSYGVNVDDFTAENAAKVMQDHQNAVITGKLTKEEQEAWAKFISEVIRYQDYRIKRFRYLSEMAKVNANSPTTSEYNKAAAEYNTAKKSLEDYFAAQKPQQPAAEPAAEEVTSETKTQ
ncbi:hypothetical protein AAIR98_001664 [Elusimicrobium simillimum]|uniref:hypothetical protein n=1 Tax=Elusimicrobium simillimum TaxID=3143438 RepID=UPI003C6F2BF3